jgi:hypothetical protein
MFQLTVIVWVVPAVVGLAIVLIIIVVYCWVKNRRWVTLCAFLYFFACLLGKTLGNS